MPSILLRSAPSTIRHLIVGRSNLPYGYLQSTLNKPIFTSTFQFKKDHRKDLSDAYHYTITATDQDKSPAEISKVIYSIIKSHPNALFFLTQKSRLLRRSETEPNKYLPLHGSDTKNLKLMIDLIKKQWLRPDGGHTAMALTDCDGMILPKSDVSLRPEEGMRGLVLTGKAIMHKGLYPSGFSTSVKKAKHTMIDEELAIISKKMLMDKTISADLTIIPISQAKIKLNDLMKNIKSARSLKLYNLCSSIVKKQDISQIDDNKIKQCVEELRLRASQIPELKEVVQDNSYEVLAALACTHAIVVGCYGNSYALDLKVNVDQDTQTAVSYCTMLAVGSEKFLDFAYEINFMDHISRLTKPKGVK